MPLGASLAEHKTRMNPHVSFWRTWPGVCAMVLVAALLFFLVTEHTAHFFGVLPFAFILVCPVMHFFMHKGHGANASGSKVEGASQAEPPEGHRH